MEAEIYLGDGLYASFDGYYIQLRTQYGEMAVYLEPEVLENFLEFVKKIKAGN